MATPDVRVRLSAEGVAEVVSALRQVETQARRTSSSASKGMGQLQGALTGVKGLLGQLAAFASVATFMKLAHDGQAAAEAMKNYGERVGFTVATMSGLRLAALRTEASLEQIGTALGIFGKKMTEAKGGSEEVRRALGAIGITGKELQKFLTLPLDKKLEAVSKQMTQMANGGEKVAVAMALMGRSGAALIPTMNSLGEKGFAYFIEQAKELGVYVDEDMAGILDELGDRFSILGLSMQTTVSQAVVGAAKPLGDLFTAISKGLGRTQDRWKAWGEGIGALLKIVLGSAFTILDSLFGFLTALGNGVIHFTQVLKLAFSGDFDGALRMAKTGVRAFGRELETNAKRQQQFWKDLISGPSDDDLVNQTKNNKKLLADLETFYRDRATVVRAAQEQALRILESNLKLQQDALKRGYDKGLITAESYYAQLTAIAQRRRDAIVKALNEQIALENKLNLNEEDREQKVSKFEADRAKAEDDYQGSRRNYVQAEADDIDKLTAAHLDAIAAVEDARGNSSVRALLELDRQYKAIETILNQLGDVAGSASDRAKFLADFRAQGLARVNLDKKSSDAGALLNDLALQRQLIEDRVNAGITSQVRGQDAILKAAKEALPYLIAAAQARRAAAEATHDQAAIDQADRYDAEVQSLKNLIQASEDFGARFTATFEDALGSGLTDLFQNGIRNAQSFGDAVVSMTLRVIDALVAMAAQFLSMKLMGALFPGGGGSSGGAGALIGAEASPVVYAATGGLTRGPGGPTGDGISARLSDWEYVVRASVVRRPGMLAFLDRLNRGLAAPTSRPATPVARFASGGLATSGPSSGGSGAMTIGLEEGLVLRHLETPQGARIVVRALANNPRAARRILGLG